MDALTTLALAGLAQAAAEGEPAPATGTPLDGLLARFPGAEPERWLLLAAGALAVYRQAGRCGLSDVSAPEPAPQGEPPACPAGAADLLAAMLTGQHAELLPEALALLRRAGRRLPPELLPAALGFGARQGNLRPALSPVIGARGRWLARFNPDWRWAEDDGALPPDAAAIWEEGTSERRLALLRRMRAENTEQGREWLVASWQSEKADFRAKAVAALAQGLSLADEPFLDAALDDRGQGVRAEAAALLARLPGSALVDRMRARADAMLDYRAPAPASGLRGLVRAVTGESGELLVTPPTTLDPAGQRDGLPPPGDLGTRARALHVQRILAAVPPEHWESRFAASPRDLIDAASRSDWRAALLGSWAEAAVTFRSLAWVGPLWQWCYAREPEEVYVADILPDRLSGLLALMSPGELQRTANRLLADASRAGQSRWLFLIGSIPAPWSLELGARYVQCLRDDRWHTAESAGDARAQSSYDFWVDTLAPAALALPPACFAAALAASGPPLPADMLAFPRWYQCLARFHEIMQIRRRLWQTIEERD